MATFRELIAYLSGRETLFTCVLFIVYAVTIQYCAHVGTQDINRYERFDSDETIPFESQLAARFSEFRVYEPDGVHQRFSATLHDGQVPIRILTFDEARLAANASGLGVPPALWAPVPRQAALEQAPVVLLFNTSLETHLREDSERARESAATETNSRTLRDSICQAVMRVASYSAHRTFVPLFTGPETWQILRPCLSLPDTSAVHQFLLDRSSVKLTLVPLMSDWLQAVWGAQRTPSSSPEASREVSVPAVGVFVFGEGADTMAVPIEVLKSVGGACANATQGAAAATEAESRGTVPLAELCTFARADDLIRYMCCTALFETTATLVKEQHRVEAVHGVVTAPANATHLWPDVHLHWMWLSPHSFAHTVLVMPQTPIALLAD